MRRYGPPRDRLAALVARHLPKRVRYWTLIDIGVHRIESHENVPSVTFTTVLEREGRALRD